MTTEGRILRGHAIVFNSLSENLGGFREVIYPEAVDRTLRENTNVYAMQDHDHKRILGSTQAGTLTLRKERDGLAFRLEMPNTSYGNDMLELVKRGDIRGMSFKFGVIPGGEEWKHENGLPTRYVRDMRFTEVTITGFPAYPATDVSVALRSLDQFKQVSPNEARRRLLASKGL